MSQPRRMSVARFNAASRSEEVADTPPVIPETMAPSQQVSRVFTFQSYFSDTLLQNALLAQRRNDPIVNATGNLTLKEEQIPGYSIGLHPSSQTPVALQFKVGGKFSSAAPLILKPGQVVRPMGLPRDVQTSGFSGFAWGIPFGWLGGGLATIVVNPSSDADVAWPGNPEVIFHRQRMKILAPADLPAAASYNWPTRFPWTQAFGGTIAAPISQAGTAQIAIEPTRVLMRLRMATVGAASRMRIVLQGTNDFDLDSAGATVLTACGYIDVTWGVVAGSGGAGNLATQYPIAEPTTIWPRLSADDGGVQLVDMTGGTLANQYVDVVRYGRL